MDEIEIIKKWFSGEFGKRKYLKIESKINSSKKVEKLLYLCQNTAPNKNDFYQCIMEIPFFMFASAEKVLMGEVLALELWQTTVNRDYNLLDKESVKHLIESIRSDCDSIKLF